MIYSENVLLCLSIPLLITVLFLRDMPRKVLEAFVLGMIIYQRIRKDRFRHVCRRHCRICLSDH